MSAEPRAGHVVHGLNCPCACCNGFCEHTDPPFGEYSVAELRESANHLARLQDEQPRRRWPHRYCPQQVSWLTMTWVEHTLDALDLLELIVDEWDQRGDGGCTKAIQDRVREALRGEQ